MQGIPDEEGQRLKAAELEAEKRYYAAIAQANPSEMRVAALAWTKAEDAFSEYLEALYPNRSSG